MSFEAAAQRLHVREPNPAHELSESAAEGQSLRALGHTGECAPLILEPSFLFIKLHEGWLAVSLRLGRKWGVSESPQQIVGIGKRSGERGL